MLKRAMSDSIDTAALQQALGSVGLSLEQLSLGGFAVALFGSRASDCWRSRSDWDLLCVGPRATQLPEGRLPGIDLVCVSDQDVHLPVWLNGDLAGHVLEYGVWLVGEPSWNVADVCYAGAVERKEARLASRVRAAARVWQDLSASYRRKQALLLRRELQRLFLLKSRSAVPPSPRLDAAWTSLDHSVAPMHAQLRSLGTPEDMIAATLRPAE